MSNASEMFMRVIGAERRLKKQTKTKKQTKQSKTQQIEIFLYIIFLLDITANSRLRDALAGILLCSPTCCGLWTQREWEDPGQALAFTATFLVKFSAKSRIHWSNIYQLNNVATSLSTDKNDTHLSPTKLLAWCCGTLECVLFERCFQDFEKSWFRKFHMNNALLLFFDIHE